MSAHKKNGVDASKSSGIVVGDSKKHYLHVGSRAKHIGFVVLGMLIIAVTIAGVRIMHRNVEKRNNGAGSTQSATRLTPFEQADKLRSVGKYDQAQQTLASLAKKAKNPNDRSDIYSQQATLASDAKRYNEAIHYAQEADATQHSSASAQLLATIAELKGDKVAARRYLQLAIDRLSGDKSTPQGQLIARNLRLKLQGLN